MAVEEVGTPHGPARVRLRPAAGGAARAVLALGHGAGGSVDAPDLAAVTAAAVEAGITVALIEQPYKVAGRRSAAPAHQLDAAWQAVVAELRAGAAGDLPLVAGGRSSGARVACRTAAATGAAAVVCLAFPLHPPGRPERSRLGELEAVTVPMLVVQGASDPFGMPPSGPGRTVVEVPGTHGLRTGVRAIGSTVRDWLSGVV